MANRDPAPLDYHRPPPSAVADRLASAFAVVAIAIVLGAGMIAWEMLVAHHR